MIIELSGTDIDVTLTSLQYSKQRVADASGTPDEVRKEDLERIDTVLAKLRAAVAEARD